jgi:hypothetical protein
MTHRIREAMRRDRSADMLAGTIMADETYIGGRPANRHAHKRTRPEFAATDKSPCSPLSTGKLAKCARGSCRRSMR